MFNLKFLFLLDFFSVAAGQQFNAAPASRAEVSALIYQYVSSLYKGGGGNELGGKEQAEGRMTLRNAAEVVAKEILYPTPNS